jgi:type VI protein secretion system component VasF
LQVAVAVAVVRKGLTVAHVKVALAAAHQGRQGLVVFMVEVAEHNLLEVRGLAARKLAPQWLVVRCKAALKQMPTLWAVAVAVVTLGVVVVFILIQTQRLLAAAALGISTLLMFLAHP